jgi:hypothetical protein
MNTPNVALGFTPFILGDLIKALLAALAIPSAWHLWRDDSHDRRPAQPARLFDLRPIDHCRALS